MPLSFDQAQALLHTQSPQWAASRKAVDSARLRREAMQGLGGPSVALTGMGYHYAVHADINLDPARDALGQVATQLPPALSAPLAQLPQLPRSYALGHSDTKASASVSAVWPLSTGGLDDAVRTGLDGLAQEAEADAATTAEQLQRQLVQRYFAAQLAARAAALRSRALDGVRAHDAAAQRMLEAGVIAKIERLQARAALAEAEQQARKAQDDAQLARSVLARTLQTSGDVQPTTPLFVLSQPLPPLETFQAAALQHHPGLGKVAAKRQQAEALHGASDALRKPQVLAFGLRELPHEGKPNWVAGVAVRWTLWDSIDRDKLSAAGQHAIEQADLTDAQVRSDIALLVEKNWLAVEQARQRYAAGQAQEEVAHELRRLRAAALKEGTGTALELIDAELNLAKVQTERASVANDYVQALAALLESTGQSEQFVQYPTQAAVLLTVNAP